jgi:hypothetical protein
VAGFVKSSGVQPGIGPSRTNAPFRCASSRQGAGIVRGSKCRRRSTGPAGRGSALVWGGYALTSMNLSDEVQNMMGQPLWDALELAKTAGAEVDPRVALEHQIAGLQAAVTRLAEEIERRG